MLTLVPKPRIPGAGRPGPPPCHLVEPAGEVTSSSCTPSPGGAPWGRQGWSLVTASSPSPVEGPGLQTWHCCPRVAGPSCRLCPGQAVGPAGPSGLKKAPALPSLGPPSLRTSWQREDTAQVLSGPPSSAAHRDPHLSPWTSDETRPPVGPGFSVPEPYLSPPWPPSPLPPPLGATTALPTPLCPDPSCPRDWRPEEQQG